MGEGNLGWSLVALKDDKGKNNGFFAPGGDREWQHVPFPVLSPSTKGGYQSHKVRRSGR